MASYRESNCRAGLRELTREALRDEILNPKAYQESVELMRIGRAEIETNPDGISLGGAFLEALNLVGVLITLGSLYGVYSGQPKSGGIILFAFGCFALAKKCSNKQNSW